MFGCLESLIEFDKLILINLIMFFFLFCNFVIFKIDKFILILFLMNTWMLTWHFLILFYWTCQHLMCQQCTLFATSAISIK